jgi:hypothetical protein
MTTKHFQPDGSGMSGHWQQFKKLERASYFH